MRTYDSENLTEATRPQAERPEQAEHAARAAAAGRRDVLGGGAFGPGGLLALQRAAGNAGITAMLSESEHADEERDGSGVHDVVGSGGAPLEAGVRADMESRFGEDFSDVRVHTGSDAHASATGLSAQAYTVGSDIVFAQDRFDPASPAGAHVLAHELTHVVQQRSGPVDGTDIGGGVNVSDPSDRFERAASENADRMMAAPPVAAQPSSAQLASASVQRHEDDTEAAGDAHDGHAHAQREEAETDELEPEA